MKRIAEWVSKNLSDMFPIRNVLKQVDTLSPLLFNFALEYVIGKVQIKQGGLNLNGTHPLLVYADDVYILRGSVHTIKKKSETLLVAGKEAGLEVNADNTKYMFMSRDQNGGRGYNIKIYNCSSERVENTNIWEKP
jgi:hypothetical protein